MAVNIGPRIGIEGEAKYRSEMNNIIAATKALKSEMTAMEATFGKNDSAMKKAAERSKVLAKAIEDQKKRVESYKEMVGASAEIYGEAHKKTQQWKQALADAETELARLEAELAKNNGIVVWGQQIQEAGQKLQEIGKGIQTVGDAMTKYVTTPIVGAGVAAVKLATGFEDSMAKVSTIADTSELSMADMEKQIKDLSNTTGIGATDIAEATYQAISAGRSTGEAVNFVANSSKLAKAGFTDVTTSVDTLTTILNAYGLSADAATSISDKLITTQNLGKTTVAELGQSLGTVIPTAAAYGVNIDNVAAAYVAMTKNGVKTSEATTYLNGMINELGKAGTTASDVLKEKTGKSFHQCMEEGMSFADVLDIVIKGADETGVELGDMFGNVRAGRAAMNIAADGAKEFNKALDAMGKTAGATDAAFQKVSNTTSSKFNKALNRIKNSGIEAGQATLTTFAPAIEKAFDKVTEATTAFNALSDEQQQNIVKWAAVAAAAGPVVSVFGRVVQVTGKAVEDFGRITEGVGRFSAAVKSAGGFAQYFSGSMAATGLGAAAVVAPLAILGGVMWEAGQKSRQATEDQVRFASEVDKVASAAEAASQHVGQVGTSISESASNIETSGASLEYFKSMLNSCYDAEGNLKEGMQKTAEYALNELNKAMGTDYSTEFVSNAENAKQALEEINGAIDSNIAKLKEQAIQQAFEKDYGEALKAQTEARAAASQAQDKYTEAVKRQKAAVEEQISASRVSGEVTAETIERQQKAATAVEQANAAVEKAGGAYKKAAGAAAEADAEVKGLEDTVAAMAEGTEESTQKAADAYGNIGASAEQAGQKAKDAVSQTIEQNKNDIEGLRQDAHDKITDINETKITPQVDAENAKTSVQTAATDMKSTIENTKMQGKISGVTGGNKAANTAKTGMKNIITPPMSGNVNKINGYGSAATVAKTGMKNIIQPPMQGNVNTVNGWSPAASIAKNGMNSIITPPMQGNVNAVNGWAPPANAAHSGMSSIISRPMNGSVGSVNNAASAASSAWSTMQSIIGRPMQAVVNVVHNIREVVSRINAHAEGGFVAREQLSWLAEGNKPEVVIPLSPDKRARAIDLFKKTEAILGMGSREALLPSLAGASQTTNFGGVTVNIYGAEGQDEEELADAVIDKITNLIGGK